LLIIIDDSLFIQKTSSNWRKKVHLEITVKTRVFGVNSVCTFVYIEEAVR